MGAAAALLSPFSPQCGAFFPSIAQSAVVEKKEIPIYLKFNQQNCPRVFWDGKYSFCVFNKGEYMQGGGGQLSCRLLI